MKSLLALVLPLAVFPAAAQVRSTSVSVQGLVRDPQQKPIAGATVRLSDTARNITRETVSSAGGGYILTLIRPGRYRLEASAPGFSPVAYEDLDLALDETARIDFTLALETVTFQVDVDAALPPIDYSRTQQSSVVTAERLAHIPINRRNHLDLALLAPGVVETAAIADQNDLRPIVAPTSNLAIAGGNGRSTLVQIDGASVTATGGFVRGDLPQVAVQEFQVNRNAYSAEFGGVTGAVLNIVSKSGANDFHGAAFAFLRHRDIQARNFFDPAKSSFTRLQSGAELAGRLVRDRAFFFAGVERLDRQEAVFVPLQQNRAALSRLTPSQEELVSFLQSTGIPDLAGLAQLLRSTLTPANNPLVLNLVDANSGVFPLGADRTTASLRLDHRLNPAHSLFFRANLTRSFDANSRFGGLNGLTNGSADRAINETLLATHTWTIRPSLAAVSRYSYGRSHFVQRPNDPFGPEYVIGGFGTVGRNGLFPQDSTERYGQLQQSLQWTSPRHTLTAGADLNGVRRDYDIAVYFGGRFIYGEFVPLGLILNAAAGSPSFSDQLALLLAALGRPALAASLAQPVSSIQSFSLGLPAAYIQGFGDSTYKAWQWSHSFFLEDSWRARPGLTLSLGLRYQHDRPPDLRPNNTWSPRFGFAWSPWKHRATVVRGGYGIFHAFVLGNIAYNQRQLNRPDVNLVFLTLAGAPGVVNPQTGLPLTSADIYQSLAASGVLGRRQILQSDLARLGIPPGFRFPTTGGVQRDYTNPYSQQASLEIEHSIGALAFSLGGEVNRGLHGWRTRDHNLVQTGTRPDGWPVFGLRDPGVVNNYVSESAANNFYHAFFAQISRRFRRAWGLNVHYTLSRATDEVADFTIEYMPHNQLDARADRALSYFHQKHRFVLSAVAESPSAGHALLRRWIFSPVVRANSARPFNVLTGTDNLGDGQTTTHRPLGLGRNAGLGPGFFSLDLRLTRSFHLVPDGSAILQFTAEGFNLANRANFLSVNNTAGPLPLSSLPRPLAGRRGNPSEPFSFTAAGDARQFQFGLRISF